jgi:hypothetical protein
MSPFGYTITIAHTASASTLGPPGEIHRLMHASEAHLVAGAKQ